MEKKDLVGVILAAGKGTRMFPFSERFPKPVLPIGGKPLLAYQLETLVRLGIRDVAGLVRFAIRAGLVEP